MEISDVRVRLVKDINQRLKAVCSVTLDREFVVRDVKIVEGTSGLFVAMPSRKLSVPCPTCRTQNHLRARYCNECGGKLPPARIPADADGREKAHRDIAHPITATFRESVQQRVLEAYQDECERDEDADYAASDEDIEADRGHSPGYDSATADAGAGGGGASTRKDRVDERGPDRPKHRRRRRGRRRPEGEPGPARDEAARERPAPATPTAQPDLSQPRGPAEAGVGSGESDTSGWGLSEPPSGAPTAGQAEETATSPAGGSEEGPTEQADRGDAVAQPSESDKSDEDSAPFGAGIF